MSAPPLIALEVLHLVSEFGHHATNSADLITLGNNFDAFTREIGFRYFAIAEHYTTDGSIPLLLENYPLEWAYEFREKGYSKRDPVHQACRQARFAFAWTDMPRFCNVSPDQIELIERGIKAGVGLGYTIPFRSPGMRMASCSFATRPGAQFPEMSLLAVQWAASLAYEAAVRINGDGYNPLSRLSSQQRICVTLMALGKSDWEISKIMNLAEDTVTKYLNAARGRYGVGRRTQLALAALVDGQIDPEDIRSWT